MKKLFLSLAIFLVISMGISVSFVWATDVKISDLPVASSVGDNDVIPIVQSGVTKKAAMSLVVDSQLSSKIAAYASTGGVALYAGACPPPQAFLDAAEALGFNTTTQIACANISAFGGVGWASVTMDISGIGEPSSTIVRGVLYTMDVGALGEPSSDINTGSGGVQYVAVTMNTSGIGEPSSTIVRGVLYTMDVGALGEPSSDVSHSISTQASDSFTGADNNLTAHTSESGHTWAENTVYSSGNWLISSNRIVTQDTGQSALDYSSLTPSSANYSVSADLSPTSNTSGSFAGVVGRAGTSVDSFYTCIYSYDTGKWQLNGYTTGDGHTFGEYTQSLSIGNTYVVKLTVGDTVSCSIDGTTRISANHSYDVNGECQDEGVPYACCTGSGEGECPYISNEAAGKAGVYGRGAAHTLDNWKVE